MSYFTGLIQQTGIVVGDPTPEFSGLESPDTNHSREAVSPLEVEEVQVAPPESRGGIERGDRPIPARATPQSLTPQPSLDMPQPSLPPTQKKEPIIAEQTENQAATEHNIPRVEPGNREISQPRMLSPDLMGEIRQDRASSPTFIEQVQVGRSAQLITNSETNSEQPEQPTPQAYMQMIREWVSQSPIAIELPSMEYSPTEQISEIGSQPSESLQPPAIHEVLETSQRTATTVQNPIAAARHTDPPDIQEFVLSIGSIQLTVETPQPLLQTPSVQSTLPQPVRLPQPDGARLSRHYLRVR
jgi:hypothetical protein